MRVYVLQNKSVEVGVLLNQETRMSRIVLLLNFFCHWALVTDNKVHLFIKRRLEELSTTSTNLAYLGARTCQIGTKHDDPRGFIIKVLTTALEAVFKQLDVSTTAATTFLVIDFVLHY